MLFTQCISPGEIVYLCKDWERWLDIAVYVSSVEEKIQQRRQLSPDKSMLL